MPCVQTEIKNNQALLATYIGNAGSLSPQNFRPNQDGSVNLDTRSASISHALIDTGAQASCVSNKEMEKLNIIPDGLEFLSGIHGSEPVYVYYVDMMLLDIAYIIQNIKIYGISGLDDSHYKAVMGMDIITRGTLHLNFVSGVSAKGICTFCI